MSAIEDLVSLLHQHRFRYSNELELQNGIERVLAGNAFEYEREVQLGRLERIDFLVEPGIGIEVKVARRACSADVGFQLRRYLGHERVKALILLTDRAQIAARIPPAIDGKPVYSVSCLSGIA